MEHTASDEHLNEITRPVPDSSFYVNRNTAHSSGLSGEGPLDGDCALISLLFSNESSLTGETGV